MNKFVDVLGDDISLIKTKENFMDIDDYNKMLKFLDWVSAAQPQNGQHIQEEIDKVITSEIVQDVFLKIWMTRESLVDVKDFKAYLFVISKNRAINALKKSLADLERMKKYASEVPFNEQLEDDDNEQLPFTLIDEAIDQLSPRQKEIFLLHRHERYSYREISEKLGIGKESVKTHLSLAIKSIKNHIETKITLIILLIDFISKKSD